MLGSNRNGRIGLRPAGVAVNVVPPCALAGTCLGLVQVYFIQKLIIIRRECCPLVLGFKQGKEHPAAARISVVRWLKHYGLEQLLCSYAPGDFAPIPQQRARGTKGG